MQVQEIIKRIDTIEDKVDKDELKKEFKIILEGMKKVSDGFLDIAQSADRIREKKLYKQMGFTTFEQFCKEIIGITRKQVYLYLRIAEATKKFPKIFDRSRVILLGTSKMDLIISGIRKIENSNLSREKKKTKIINMTGEIDVNKTVGEIETLVKKHTKNIR